MPHRSRLASLCIDCPAEDLDAAVAFWSGALGVQFRRHPEGRYAAARPADDLPHILLQRVEHAARVHLDIETDDKEAERTRLEAERARLVERHPAGWLVMQAPTGHRFCLVAPVRPDFAENAREHAA